MTTLLPPPTPTPNTTTNCIVVVSGRSSDLGIIGKEQEGTTEYRIYTRLKSKYQAMDFLL